MARTSQSKEISKKKKRERPMEEGTGTESLKKKLKIMPGSMKEIYEKLREKKQKTDKKKDTESSLHKVLVSGVYKVVNLLNEDEEGDIQGDEDEKDDMEGDEEEEEEEKEKEEVEDEDEETCCDDSGTMVKRKHSKPRPRATNASAIMSLPSNASVFADLSTRAQMQQVNDMPSEPPSLLATSAEQEDNETFTHDSSRSTSIDLGASVDGSSSRLRGRGLDVGLQTSIDPSERLLITPVGESTFFERRITTTITRIIKNHFNGPWPTWRKVPNDVKELMFKKFQAIKMKRDVSFLEVFNRTHKRMGGQGNVYFCTIAEVW
ncbi:Uncharacterized protein TCM_040009 [Theobroma cacao]|uniref:Uncharacterized protein n=1 Tax=Theobroma cacao TaxID=3641 RepID=A0A061GYQ2_THECC|nr:Uncharacterized protein TCM_040009 [Theobroma cacao]